jgi:hypothetical protein
MGLVRYVCVPNFPRCTATEIYVSEGKLLLLYSLHAARRLKMVCVALQEYCGL